MLPIELYTEIVRCLPRAHRTLLLSVSRTLHNVALRFIFSTVKIYLMHGRHSFTMLNTENERYVVETSAFCSHRSWEILQHIISTPSFASVVKTLSVHAFTDGPQIFEYRNNAWPSFSSPDILPGTLALALKSLPNLQSLHYYGDNPSFSNVASSVPPSVTSLRIQSMPESHLLSHLHSLRRFEASIPFTYVRDQKLDRIFAESQDSANTRDFVDIVENNPLRELVILSKHLPLLPIWMCNNLTQIEICVIDWEPIGAQLLFRHAMALESLSLVGYIDSSLFNNLPLDNVLPGLTSFTLSCELWDEDAVGFMVPYLLEFLERRLALRRLYIRLPGISLQSALLVAGVIGKLPKIRVLGFHLGCEPIHESGALQLAEQLSTHIHLEALHLAIAWITEIHLTWYPIILHQLQQLPDLSFLSLFSCGEDPVPIHPVELATDLPRLCLVGLQRSLFTIERDNDEVLEPKLWAPWTVKYCIPEDFESDDHAWLFRYH
ncbi:hypothetical protein C8F01DRAFT_233256 [Mycena amicta]|nr:hypothetical protein C8F01DRAFT_233256 [Mycena amicta]